MSSAKVWLSLLLALPLIGAPLVRAESFLLKSGGEVEGELLNPKKREAEPFEVRTPDGVRFTVPRESVAKVLVKREMEHEYERRLPKVADTAEAHWQMAEWCREQGLKAQREYHLQQVVKHEPDHAAARLALGQQKLGGKWQRMEEYKASQGYVKHQGQWRTPQDVSLLTQQEEREAEVIKWRQQIKIWRSWLGKKRDAEAIANFRQIRDAHAAPTLLELLDGKGQPHDFRLLLIDVLGDLPGYPGDGAFAKLSMVDPNQSIRDACIDQLVRHKSKPAVFAYIGILKDDKSPPDAIKRAAIALGRLKDPIAAPALIDALVTTHEIIVQPGSSSSGGLGPMTNSFSNDGSGGGGGGGFGMGTPKPIKTKVTNQNDQVLAALNSLFPGVNFGFDEAAWKRWYAQTHEPPKVNLRRGE